MRLSTWAFASFSFAMTIGTANAELPLPIDGGEAASVPMAVPSPTDVGLYRFAATDDLQQRQGVSGLP